MSGRIVTACLLLMAIATVGVAQEESAGRVKELDGLAYITSNGQRTAARVGSVIYQGDELETGEDGSMGVTFNDESQLSLGPNTTLVVDEFVYKPQDGSGSFVTRVSRGTLLFVSGLIAKMSPDSARVETPVGTIGIRGTKFLVEIEERVGS